MASLIPHLRGPLRPPGWGGPSIYPATLCRDIGTYVWPRLCGTPVHLSWLFGHYVHVYICIFACVCMGAHYSNVVVLLLHSKFSTISHFSADLRFDSNTLSDIFHVGYPFLSLPPPPQRHHSICPFLTTTCTSYITVLTQLTRTTAIATSHWWGATKMSPRLRTHRRMTTISRWWPPAEIIMGWGPAKTTRGPPSWGSHSLVGREY